MEKEFRHEQQAHSAEVPHYPFDIVQEQLGFIETDELKSIRCDAVEASKLDDRETVVARVHEYQLCGEELVNSIEGSGFMRGQIGLIVAKASLRQATGDRKAFLYDIADAVEYAVNIYEDEVANVLERMPSLEIVRVLLVYGEEFGLDEKTVVDIADSPYEHALEKAYDYLTQVGLNAERILNDFLDDIRGSN